MATVHATYEAGVFRPHAPVNLPDHCEVEFEPKVIKPVLSDSALPHVYDVLAERYEPGEKDVAARHNEHQPPPR